MFGVSPSTGTSRTWRAAESVLLSPGPEGYWSSAGAMLSETGSSTFLFGKWTDYLTGKGLGEQVEVEFGEQRLAFASA